MPLVLRCPPCVAVRHRDCLGRGSCACRSCQAAPIIRDARTRLASTNSTGLLRESLAECLALLDQRNSREYQIATRPPKPGICSECKGPLVSKPAGRDRVTCSWRCRARRKRRLQRERDALLAKQAELAKQEAA